MKKRFLMMCLFLPLTGHAGLNVIVDLGGEDATPYFDGINKQPGLPEASLPTTQPPVSAMAAMFPVSTPEMTPGVVADRPLQLSGIGALFLIGDDVQSRSWLAENAKALIARHAAGLIVSVDSASAVQSLRSLAPGVPMAPASGSELSRRLQLRHYPVLITDTGLSQQVRP
ncbi:integrating conjugative element protein [Edwardsiella ictaluri]|uniref:integrating conjugative element protein n=1 Tax=Edwardsiella ictaluri TaxID=67780 RepID=UPI0018DC3795|nr:integrating conjugative element protein [Edwardsiella ictaluri]QPW28843.1 integrating conjugative element protein [Edwardsiella ictaluri]UYB61959.1 integrating conjugative element protein [Edwardsiella ictaluri]UYB65184.1 integrating conjugative element protein [Edwardsiella ictaluri]WJH19916.1 integrating conjugative element protein [Edwardsiella ictaluri]BEH97520.1 integrating conjugative element protein [Edwardsiella ictaluri]